MSEITEITQGQILTGVMFNEPMRVVTTKQGGTGTMDRWPSGPELRTVPRGHPFPGRHRKPQHHGSQRILRCSTPYFGLSISRVDPLPNQLEAVYEYFMKLPSVRFLLTDDAGAGKTIMTGLLIRELKLRGLVEQMLIVCPANLTFQWQRELLEKFDQQFVVMRGSDIHNQFGMNQWLERPQVITSLPQDQMGPQMF